MTVTTKELKTIADFEALKWGDCLAIEFEDGSLKVYTVDIKEFIFGFLCLENQTQRFNYKKLVEENFKFAKVTLIESDVNGGK